MESDRGYTSVRIEPIRETRIYAPCPWCHKKASDITYHIEHAPCGPFPPWHCNACGRLYVVQIGADKAVHVNRKDGEATYSTLVLLRIPAYSEPIYLVVSATQYRPEEPCGEGDAYFYDEYTCPSNWLGDVEVVIQGDSTDPHGIAQWVASIPAGDLLDEDEVARGGMTKLETLGRDPLPGGGWEEQYQSHARRVLALFGVEDSRVTVDSYAYRPEAPLP